MSLLGDIAAPVLNSVGAGGLAGDLGLGGSGGGVSGWLDDLEKYTTDTIQKTTSDITNEVINLSIYLGIFLIALVCTWALLAPSESQVGTITETATRVAAATG